MHIPYKKISIQFELAVDALDDPFKYETDTLFGKRTATKDAHDRYANQQVSCLLRQIEEYSGMLILASNLKSNIDDVFLCRFQTVVRLPIPSPRERYSERN